MYPFHRWCLDSWFIVVSYLLTSCSSQTVAYQNRTNIASWKLESINMESTLLPVGNAIMGWAREGTNWVESPASVSFELCSTLRRYIYYWLIFVQSWPLTSFPFAAQVAIGYLCCLAIGCVVMPNLPAVPGLYPFKFLYNITQVMLCSYMCIEACIRAYTAGYTLTPCNAFQPDTNPITFILYIFYLSKILDFADTLFIVLEKRWKQLSFLHVYHHTSIFLVIYFIFLYCFFLYLLFFVDCMFTIVLLVADQYWLWRWHLPYYRLEQCNSHDDVHLLFCIHAYQ